MAGGGGEIWTAIFLINEYDGRGPIPRPPQSPDLTPIDFRLGVRRKGGVIVRNHEAVADINDANFNSTITNLCSDEKWKVFYEPATLYTYRSRCNGTFHRRFLSNRPRRRRQRVVTGTALKTFEIIYGRFLHGVME